MIEKGSFLFSRESRRVIEVASILMLVQSKDPTDDRVYFPFILKSRRMIEVASILMLAFLFSLKSRRMIEVA